MINLKLELEVGKSRPQTILFLDNVELMSPEEIHVEISTTIEKTLEQQKELGQ